MKYEERNPFATRFGCSSPDTRNMDVLLRQADGLRKRASNDPEYVEFVATNMERIAKDYADVYEKMIAARSQLIKIQELTIQTVGKNQAIHHIDGNPLNNDPANLMIVDLK